MTTNIYDYHGGFVTSDSRWSIQTPSKALIYVDNSGYEKVEQIGQHVFVFAGDVAVIDHWKLYLRAREGKLEGERPSLQGVALFIVELATSRMVGWHGQDIVREDDTGQAVASFAGTGSQFAYRCWDQNKCAKKAVNSAVAQDYFSGLPLKFLNLRDVNDKDCDSVLDLKALYSSFKTKGMVMKPTFAQPVPLVDAAVNDPEIKHYMDAIAQGKAQIQAPCDAMFNKPSAEDEARMNSVLDKIFGA